MAKDGKVKSYLWKAEPSRLVSVPLLFFPRGNLERLSRMNTSDLAVSFSHWTPKF